ncbi:hypothetical protein SCHPADRAFT_862370 [Schizopora paradoxa]|uniref:Transmembrane protein n=1 Tax=Schizopora paradoxa TaxID=27342 RepID=A0A0H2R199_9AGAM|nr:hypothetical protein SCHPADRAFT_862370 [Schizopora paradoxa]
MSTFNFLLDDTSPFYVYKPYANGQGNQTANGWVQYFSQNGFNSAGGEDGSGDSSHITSFQGATVSLQFFGTDVTLFGTANGTYTISLDGTLQQLGSPPSNQLFSTSGLSNEAHTITLSFTDSSGDDTKQLAFAGANLTSTTQTQSSLQTHIIDNSNTTAINYAGTWSTSAAHQIPEPYQITKTSGSSASMEFQGRAIAINGMTNFGWWVYQVELDGVPYNRNASCLFINPNSTLFYQDGLDETKTHTVNITNVSGGMNLAVTSFTVFASGDIQALTQPTNTSSNSTSPTTSPAAANTSSGSSSNSGTIAGAVIGVLAFLALVAGLIFWFRRKRNARSAVAAYPHEDMEKYYNRPEIYVNVENGARTVTMGRQPTFQGQRVRKGASSAFSPVPLSDTTTGSSDSRGRDSLSSPSTLQATESPSSAILSWHPPGLAANPGNEKRRPLPRVPEQQVPQQQAHAPPSVFSHAESGQSDEHVDRIANIIMERMANRLGTMVQDEHVPPPQYE